MEKVKLDLKQRDWASQLSRRHLQCTARRKPHLAQHQNQYFRVSLTMVLCEQIWWPDSQTRRGVCTRKHSASVITDNKLIELCYYGKKNLEMAGAECRAWGSLSK